VGSRRAQSASTLLPQIGSDLTNSASGRTLDVLQIAIGPCAGNSWRMPRTHRQASWTSNACFDKKHPMRRTR
jgi:hypothetical protein